ncbi:hypothetical protein JaAD80_02955 [Janthinobacterium sp. AD80]|nr:hypothetical protein JaAD80_02955 [Janthinobacterium sp. AD80]
MGLQRRFGLRMQCLAGTEEVPRQHQDVGRTLDQRRQAQLDHVQAVKQVFAEGAGTDHGRQVGVAGADDAHLHLPFAVRAEALEAARFQHAQQFHLPGQRQVADFVQKQGAAVGRIELAVARTRGPRVGARFRAKQFGLDQVDRHGAAIEHHEGAAGDLGIGLHDGGDVFLAAAVRTGNEHRHVGARHLARQVHDAFRGRVLPDHAAQIEAVFERVALAPLLHHALAQGAAGLSQFQQVVHGRDQAPVIPWLGQVVGRARLDQVDGRIELRPCRQQDHGQVRMARADGVEQGAAFLARGGVGREVHVLHHQVDGMARQQGQALLGRGGAQRIDLVQREQHVERDGHGGIVVNYQYGRHARSITFSWPP